MTGLPQSWSKDEVCDAYRISPREIDRLIKAGKLGYYQAGRSRRFFAEHLDQLSAALNRSPQTQAPVVGITARSAARRRLA